MKDRKCRVEFYAKPGSARLEWQQQPLEAAQSRITRSPTRLRCSWLSGSKPSSTFRPVGRSEQDPDNSLQADAVVLVKPPQGRRV